MATIPATLPQKMADMSEKARDYIYRARARALVAHLPVRLETMANGRIAVYVASQSRADVWHRVRHVGNRYLCNCEAMYSPPSNEYPYGHYNRWPSCIHAQTVYLMRNGQL